MNFYTREQIKFNSKAIRKLELSFWNELKSKLSLAFNQLPLIGIALAFNLIYLN